MKTNSSPARLKIIYATLVASFVLSIGANAQTPSDPDRPNRPNLPGGEARRGQPGAPGGLRPGQGLPVMEQLLTEDQRDSMRQALESQREKLRDIQDKIRVVRKALMTAALADDFKDEVVRAKALEVAKLEAELTVVRLKALSDVQPALSQEQLDKLMNFQPQPGSPPGGDNQRPNNRRMNRGPRDGGEMPRPPKPDDQ
jgi:Spy/CpxP family protein refolding chaperone